MDITTTQELGSLRAQTTKDPKFPAKPALQKELKPLLKELKKKNMQANLEKFTSFHTRYYKSDYGRQSSEWLLEQVQTIIEDSGADKYGAYAKPFTHSWGQNSVIATIPGENNSTVVVGAHQDSINLFLPSIFSAPGADDDVSHFLWRCIFVIPFGLDIRRYAFKALLGFSMCHSTLLIVARVKASSTCLRSSRLIYQKAILIQPQGSGTVTILEALRVLLTSADVVKGKAQNTIEFHWYSAEEGGLLGSQAIFTAYEKEGRDIKAMLQQDMTGYVQGTLDAGKKESVGVITDFVNPALTDFIKEVVTEAS